MPLISLRYSEPLNACFNTIDGVVSTSYTVSPAVSTRLDDDDWTDGYYVYIVL